VANEKVVPTASNTVLCNGSPIWLKAQFGESSGCNNCIMKCFTQASTGCGIGTLQSASHIFESVFSKNIAPGLPQPRKVWVDFTDVDFESRLWPRRIPLNQPLEASRGLEALRCCCEHLYVMTPDAGGRLGRYLSSKDGNDFGVLKNLLRISEDSRAGKT